MARSAEIRDAVVAAINNAGFSPTPKLVAIPIYDLAADLEQLAGGRIVVMPQTKALRGMTRANVQAADITIDVAVQFKGKDIQPATLDPYLNVSEAIPDLFLGTTLKTQSGISATCTDVTWPHGLFIQAHMSQFRCLTAVTSLKFTVN